MLFRPCWLCSSQWRGLGCHLRYTRKLKKLVSKFQFSVDIKLSKPNRLCPQFHQSWPSSTWLSGCRRRCRPKELGCRLSDYQYVGFGLSNFSEQWQEQWSSWLPACTCPHWMPIFDRIRDGRSRSGSKIGAFFLRVAEIKLTLFTLTSDM